MAGVRKNPRLARHPVPGVRPEQAFVDTPHAAIEAPVFEHALFDLAGILMPAPAERRLIRHARGRDVDHQRLPPADHAALKNFVEVVRLAGAPPVKLIANDEGRLNSIVNVAIGRERRIERTGVVDPHHPLRRRNDLQAFAEALVRTDHLDGRVEHLPGLILRGGRAVDFRPGTWSTYQAEDHQTGAERRFRILLWQFQVGVLVQPDPLFIERAEQISKDLARPIHQQERLAGEVGGQTQAVLEEEADFTRATKELAVPQNLAEPNFALAERAVDYLEQIRRRQVDRFPFRPCRRSSAIAMKGSGRTPGTAC